MTIYANCCSIGRYITKIYEVRSWRIARIQNQWIAEDITCTGQRINIFFLKHRTIST
jgi:hypothetical protein